MDKVNRFEYLFLALIVFLTIVRVFFGIDFSDEAQYVSQAFSPFVAGGFFKSDYFIQQILYFFYYPIIWVYFIFFGTSGSFLFLRILFVLEAIIASWFIYRYTSERFGVRRSLLLSAGIVAFTPFSIFSISYNNILCHFLPVILAFHFFYSKKSKLDSLFVGFLMVVTMFSYPPFLVMIVILFCLTFFGNKIWLPIRHDPMVWVVFFVASMVFSGFLLVFYREGIFDAFSFSSTFAKLRPLDKIFLLLSQIKKIGLVFLLLVAVSFSPVIKRKIAISSKFVFFLIFAYCLYVFRGQLIPSHNLILSLFITIIVYFSFNRISLNKDVLLFVTLCGIMSFVCSYSSSNGIINSSIPLVVPTFVLVFSHISTNRFSIGCIWGIVFLILLTNYTYFYREDSFNKLNSRIETGPYKGLITSNYRKNILKEFDLVVSKLTDSPGRDIRLLSFFFPAVYTYSKFIPETRMFYVHDAFFSNDQKIFLFDGLKPDFLLIFKESSTQTRDELMRSVCINCNLFLETNFFSVYKI